MARLYHNHVAFEVIGLCHSTSPMSQGPPRVPLPSFERSLTNVKVLASKTLDNPEMQITKEAAGVSHTTKEAAGYVSDKACELACSASKEVNKTIAKDSHASLSTRATAAKDAICDKSKEMKYGASAEVHKKAAGM
ncbi:hypothetical protein KEM48_013932 [Puccinia striiformis f. sp. tritici PST-130]|uniref:Uncharacterized protein n=3 Tax=Puccinia striiformis TaxID=27350 RepID=A0A0L0V180_9BASI|nr:hypothetical protein KEM48_013932 [Puccinia striiformis f. sp. tritici PST-130]KNE93052.1 hypothetical protein PSTG_13545 [Puccinia striiformis f. sp. tritici PST-78]